ncbi:MAG: T9SS type A sorting domain-containing protein [Bacteroidales bacterium]|nr:T9SS type A sorting domain-containing protein [Bacteroidales bacterium]
MKTRYIPVILIVFLATTEITWAQWVPEVCPVKEDLNAVCFINESQGWAVGDKGTIISKVNGTWTRSTSPIKEDLYCVTFITRENGWAVGANGTILRYNGYAWEKINSPTGNDLLTVSFGDSEKGVITGENGTILVFSGNTWKQLDKRIKANLYAAQYLNDDIFLGGGMELLNVPIMKMAVKWGYSLTNIFDSNIAVLGLAFTSPDNGWIIGSPGVLMHFDGKSWVGPGLDYKFPSLNHISLSDENNGLSVGFSGTILAFEEGTWIREESGTNMHLNGSSITAGNYYAVGDQGTILVRSRNKDKEELQTKEIPDGAIRLFPNPCRDFLNIGLTLLENNSPVIMSIMDLKGKVVEQKELDFSKGNLPVTISTADYKPGTYLVKVKTGSKILLGRFIVN